MATCKLCNRTGFFLSVNQFELCYTCNEAVYIEISSRFRVIKESVQLVDNGKTFDTRISRCDLIVDLAKELLKFEAMKIPSSTPPPSEIIQTYESNKRILIKEYMLDESRKALEKSKISTTTASKVSAISKVILKINDYIKKFPDEKDLVTMESGLRKAIQEIQLNAFVEDGKKAEFKGNKKKALDKYYEALYFLQHDEIDDALQSDVINTIDAKIRELSTP